MGKTKRQSVLLLGLAALLLVFVATSACAARPPRPGPNFVWVEAHVGPAGNPVPGHWKYVGPAVQGKVWVPGHRNAAGVWVSGHWKVVRRPGPAAVWVPGHYGPGGRWVPGHWR